MRSRLLVIPSVADIESFSQLVTHLGHYFSHVDFERIVIPIDASLIDDATSWLDTPALPSGVAQEVLERIAATRDRITLRPWPSNLGPPALTTDLILDWDVKRSELEPWATLKKQFRVNRTRFEVDWRGIRQGGSWFAEASKILVQGRTFDAEAARQFQDLTERIGPVDRAFVIGTGPSASEAVNHDLSAGVRIVCNTMVLDDELMSHISPHILTFADPIFHFGPSTYAQRFQGAVVEQSKKHDFTIVTTERYVPLLKAHLPELDGRIIGLRQGTTAWVDNFDLHRHPAVRPHPNVLTMLMLPLAASFARSVALIGFDGRAAGDSGFWKHGSTVQLGTELEEIRKVHPGFFNVDYDDYYGTHVAQVEAMIRHLEARGVEVRSLTDSMMVPLRRRPQVREAPVVVDDIAGPRVVSITPDWVDDFGHYGPFERRLHQAATDAGIEHIAFGSAAMTPIEDWQIPCFTDPGTNRGGGRFRDEVLAALAAVPLGHGSVVVFYAADVWHLAALVEAAARHPSVRFVVNLMKAHGWIYSALHESNPWARSLADHLGAVLSVARGTNLDITVDTKALADDVNSLIGVTPVLWPMMAVATTPEELAPTRTGGDAVHIVSPVHAHSDKGFFDVLRLSRLLEERIGQGDLAVSVRHAPQPTPIGKGIDDLADKFAEIGVDVVRQNLSDEGFADLIRSADVVLIPYKVRPFRTRTSGVVLDAILAGKPVVSVKDTWAGELVERYDAGITYEEGDIEAMRHALDAIIEDLDSYRQQVASIRKSVEFEFAPARLVEFLVERAALPATSPSAGEIHELLGRADGLRDLYGWRTRNDDSRMMDVAVVEDDRARSHESFKDQINSLEHSLEWHRRTDGPATAPEVDLRRMVYPRSAHARIDECKLVALMIDPKGTDAGRMVDVGAHHGSALIHFLSKGWAIEAFEPDSRHYEYLESRYGKDERVSLHSRAVTEVSGERRTLYISEESTGVSALAPFLDSHHEAETVETVALRDALSDLHVDVLKIDTEGFDLAVLEGFPWEIDAPDVVICEFEDRKSIPLGYSLSDLGDFLVNHGYQVWMSEWHPVIRYGQKHDWHRLVEYPSEPASPEAWGNFIAFKHPRAQRTVAAALASCIQADEPEQATIQTDPEPGPSLSRSAVDPVKNRVLSTDDASSTVLRRTAQRLRAGLGSLRGVLRPILVTSVVLAVLSAGLAIFDQLQLALVVGAASVAAASAGILVLAVRLERRSR
jgi:FkbM family methyltransferase